MVQRERKEALADAQRRQAWQRSLYDLLPNTFMASMRAIYGGVHRIRVRGTLPGVGFRISWESPARKLPAPQHKYAQCNKTATTAHYRCSRR